MQKILKGALEQLNNGRSMIIAGKSPRQSLTVGQHFLQNPCRLGAETQKKKKKKTPRKQINIYWTSERVDLRSPGQGQAQSRAIRRLSTANRDYIDGVSDPF